MRVRVSKGRIIGAAVSIFAAGLAAWSVLASATTGAAPAPSTFNGVDQVALQKCMAQMPPVNCEAIVPGLAQCMAQQLPCNQAAEADRKAKYGPARPTTDFGPPMTQAEAVSAALGSANPSTTLTTVKEMTYGAYVALAGDQADPDISLDRSVWVVTVHAPIRTQGPAAASAQLKQVYTVAIDAASRVVIEIIAGRGLL